MKNFKDYLDYLFEDSDESGKYCDCWSDFVTGEEIDEYDGTQYNVDNPLLVKFRKDGIIYKMVDHYGGEGQGNEYWTVFSVEKDNIKTFYKLQGWYVSYNGCEWQNGITGFKEVKPVKKMVTFYE